MPIQATYHPTVQAPIRYVLNGVLFFISFSFFRPGGPVLPCIALPNATKTTIGELRSNDITEITLVPDTTPAHLQPKPKDIKVMVFSPKK
jgi:hypothetical protein